MKRLALPLLLAATSFALTACAAGNGTIPADPGPEIDRAPAWITAEQVEGPALWAVGSAAAIDDPGSLRRTALGNAREDLAAQIATRLGPVLEREGIVDEDARHEIAASIVAVNLYGAHVERYWVAPSGRCYVRYEIPLETYVENVLAARGVDEELGEIVVAAARAEFGPALAR